MLRSTIADIPLDCLVLNASGPRTGSLEALLKIAESESGAVVSKSVTLEERNGNPLPRFINNVSLGDSYCSGSISAEGLPNYGIDYYIHPDAIKAIKASGKPYIISLSGLSLQENLILLEKVYDSAQYGIDAIEFNVACPNIPGKPMIGYDLNQFEEVLKAIVSLPRYSKIPLGIKLPPYFDPLEIEKVAIMLAKYPIRFITTTNNIGNGLVVDCENECESLRAKEGFGGLGGGFIKHTALANVRAFYLLLHEQLGRRDISIVGVGGISSGRDAFEIILCGAQAVQVGTCHWVEGPGCFRRISEELREIMRGKGYASIDDFRGKLKPFAPRPGTIKAKREEGARPRTAWLLTALLVVLLALLLARSAGEESRSESLPSH